MFEVTPATFHQWAARPGYHVLIIHRDNCIPCKNAWPLFEKLSRKFAHPTLNYGQYKIKFTKEDRELMRYMEVTATPTFQVYTVRREPVNAEVHMNRLFSVTSTKRIPELEFFLADLDLD